MRFGESDDTKPVDYTLREDHPGLEKVLGGEACPEPKVYVGGVLWADEGFKGLIYPQKAKAADYVKYYTQQFNTIELNSTHYRIPAPETFQRWYEIAPDDFRFCPKINQEISHAPDLLPKIGFHNACNQLFETLGDKLGTSFLQLPPNFSTQRYEELITFLDNSELQNLAIELRHESWFTDQTAFNRFCNYLYKNKMALVITDTPGRRDVVHMRLTNQVAFIRFKAANDDVLDKQRMDDWIRRAPAWFSKGLKEFYFFIHTANKADMPYLAVYFIKRLEEVCGIKIKPPTISGTENTLF